MDADTIITFGKHKDKAIKDVPPEYLYWLETKIARYAPNKRSLWEKYFLAYIATDKRLDTMRGPEFRELKALNNLMK